MTRAHYVAITFLSGLLLWCVVNVPVSKAVDYYRPAPKPNKNDVIYENLSCQEISRIAYGQCRSGKTRKG